MATWQEFVATGFEVAESKGMRVTGQAPNQATELLQLLSEIWAEYGPETREGWSKRQVRTLLRDEIQVQ